MFYSPSSIDASKYMKARDIYQNKFCKVIQLLIYCYGQLIVKERPEKFPSRFKLENHFTNILVGYLKDNKSLFDLKNLGFEIEVGEINFDSKKVKFIDIKVTNASHYFLGKYDEDIYYAIECKRLNKYSQKIKYYIDGGILRFVETDYAKNLPLAIMIGYAEKGDMEIIVDKINDRLDKKFAGIETLRNLTKYNVEPNFDFCYHSRHIKKDKIGKISLYHLIFDYSALIS